MKSLSTAMILVTMMALSVGVVDSAEPIKFELTVPETIQDAAKAVTAVAGSAILASPVAIVSGAFLVVGSMGIYYYFDYKNRQRIEIELYESGMIRKIMLPADRVIVITVVAGIVIVACVYGAVTVYRLIHRNRN